MSNHHRFLLQLHVQHIDALDAALNAIDREVDIHIEPFREAVLLLTTIPGVNDLSAQVIRAEIGGDMSRFEERMASFADREAAVDTKRWQALEKKYLA